MMRGMKDEEKEMNPMFPRVHINDAEKGCQRAPPRNKMALYEQLSIPSQRFSSIVPSTSSTHIGGRQRVMLTSFCKSPVSTYGAKKLTSYPSAVVKLNDMAKEETKAPVLRITRPFSSDYKGNKDEDNKISIDKDEDEDEVRVPVSAQAPKHPTNGNKNKDGDFFSQQFQTPGTHLTTDLSSRRMDTGHAEEKRKMTPTNQLEAENSALVPEARKKPSKLEFSKRIECLAESSGRECSSFDHISKRLPASAEGTSAFKHEKLVRPRKDIGEKNGSILIGKSCLVPSVQADKESSLENESGSEEDKNSASTNIISADDVVGVIGEKQFWDTRKMIINQRRIFALQVFELHRVMKIQKLIAESPHLLLKHDLYLKKSAMKAPTPTKLPTESALQPLPLSSSHKGLTRILISPQPCDSEALKELITKQFHDDLHSRNVGTNSKLEPWCFPLLPASQWLVPVTSPSGGLIYIPLTGICPPNAGFFNAAYGLPRDAKQLVGIPPKTPPLNHGMLLDHQSLSCSAVEQTSTWARNQLSQTSQVMPCKAEKSGGLKGSELQGSTASSPVVPMAATVEESDRNTESRENKPRVIKVVPHNPRTATESAARIFQLIQEERRQI